MELFNKILKAAVDGGASDIHIKVGTPVVFRISRELISIDCPIPTEQWLNNVVDKMTPVHMKKKLEEDREIDFSYNVVGMGRFRTNVFQQRGTWALAMRYVKAVVPSFQQLGLLEQIKTIAESPRGIVMVAGSTGSGKSTTLAAMLEHINSNFKKHIVTLEDPIEFIFPHHRSLVDQREVGIDTLTFGDALRNAMRESPDVIMIGEIRDMETAHHAIAYAESGHLCLSTMHANNANQAIERILNYFPALAQKQILLDLSLHLEAVISQRLVRGVDGKRVVAAELLRQSGYISEMIRKGRLNEIKHEMELGNQPGVMTFDQSLFHLYQRGKISRDEALHNADSHTDLALLIRLAEHRNVSDAPTLTLLEPNSNGSYD